MFTSKALAYGSGVLEVPNKLAVFGKNVVHTEMNCMQANARSDAKKHQRKCNGRLLKQ